MTQSSDAVFPEFSSLSSYTEHLSQLCSLPKGFSIGKSEGKFIAVEAPSLGELPINLNIVYLPDGPTRDWSAVFTSNKFPGAPIHIGRSMLSSNVPLQALVINNKVSNVCSSSGIEDAADVCESVATALNLSLGGKSVLPSSTGVIGWNLPSEALKQIIPGAVTNLQTESALPFAEGIMTTDRYPKLRSATLSTGARIVGVAKGAGMIEPNMATMLCYILTDAKLEASLDSLLQSAVDVSFNSISVDGAESTSDTAVLVSSSKIPTPTSEFEVQLNQICKDLAADLVRNGEGTSHVIRITLSNFSSSRKDAVKLGRHIVNSPLFKCAVAGNDPNIGRLAGAVGSFLGTENANVDPGKITFTIGGKPIFKNGIFCIDGDDTEQALSAHMKNAMFNEEETFPSHQRFVEVGVDFGEGTGEEAIVLGSDLTQEYATINADYRS